MLGVQYSRHRKSFSNCHQNLWRPIDSFQKGLDVCLIMPKIFRQQPGFGVAA